VHRNRVVNYLLAFSVVNNNNNVKLGVYTRLNYSRVDRNVGRIQKLPT